MSQASPEFSAVPNVGQLIWALHLSGHVWDVLTSSLPRPVQGETIALMCRAQSTLVLGTSMTHLSRR